MANKDIISVLNGALDLHQIPDGFKTTIDAVILAAACPIQEGQSVLDLGCGVGSAGLCVAKRVTNATLYGIDIQNDHVATAQKNATLNNLNARFEQGDIRDFKTDLVDHVICNPPYEEAGAHKASPSDKNATARGHLDGDITIDDWVKCAFNNLRSGGSLTIIHKSAALQKIMYALGKSFGASELIPLWPKHGQDAKRVIIRTIKHRKSPARIHSGLVLHNEDGTYTDTAEQILRDMKALK